MSIYKNSTELTKALLPYRNAQKIGFVPTMGALHEGHLSLVSTALATNDVVVVSIFVNPTQFDNASDLVKYPRTLDKDVALLKTLQGNVLVYSPEANELYNGKVVSRNFNYGPIANEMEGRHRTGHFDGVGTVVSLLLKTIKPDFAYFGEKDFQQLQIVKKLVLLDNIDTTIVGCPIVREPNGVAMSSRNKRLSANQLEAAKIISQTLNLVKQHFNTASIAQLNKMAMQAFKQSELTLEYFEIANVATLKTVKRKRKGNRYRAFIAAFAGEVRLIDNMALN